MRKICLAIGMSLLLAACGGGSSTPSMSSTTGSSGGSTPPPPAAGSNVATIVVDDGPASLTSGPNGTIQTNIAYVTVTVCAPGTSNCQTIDHVLLDTGSVGLRLEASAIGAGLLAALPKEMDAAGDAVGECYGFVDGYAFGSVRTADFKIAGETVAGMPLQALGDTGPFASAPASCSSGGGASLDSVSALGANGILGVGVTATDCGVLCTTASGSGAATYYDCPLSGCGQIIARAASTTAPFQQLPNPVAAMSQDNNGVIISLPSAPPGGASSLTGSLYFGIGTRANNALGSAIVLTTTTSLDPSGPGFVTAIYKGQALADSFLDSGTNFYAFVDSAIQACSGQTSASYYCPNSPLSIGATLQGANGASADASFTLQNAATLLATTYAALPGLGGNPDSVKGFTPIPNSFDFGLPFFFGRKVYTAIEGRSAGGATGPFFAY